MRVVPHVLRRFRAYPVLLEAVPLEGEPSVTRGAESIEQWSEKRKDYVAEMVLAVVREVVRWTPVPLEPTGIRVDPEMLDAVNRRAS